MSVAGLAVGAGVAGAVLLVVGWWRRDIAVIRHRVQVLGTPSRGVKRVGGSAHPRMPRVTTAVVSSLRTLGSAARGAARRTPDPARDLSTGAALVAGSAVAVVLGPVIGVAAAAGVVVSLCWWERRLPQRREAEVRAVLPDVVDLFRLAVGAGLSVHEAVEVVAPSALEPVGGSLQEVCRRVELGVRLGDALVALDDLGDGARSLQSALTAAARYGAPLGAALDRVVVDARMLRRRRAEEHARKLPVKLLFPLVLCVLPAFGLLAVVPLLAGSLPSLTSGP